VPDKELNTSSPVAQHLKLYNCYFPLLSLILHSIFGVGNDFADGAKGSQMFWTSVQITAPTKSYNARANVLGQPKEPLPSVT